MPGAELPRAAGVLAVFAHPDDESFGLGAVLGAFVGAGARVRALCFTHGEASTLGSGDLGTLRAEELHAAADVLGLSDVELLDYPDGGLARVGVEELARQVVRASPGADLLLAFDDGGITGHPDHQQATVAAVRAAEVLNLPVLAWAVPATVAGALNAELGTAFVGRAPDDLDITVAVDRRLQRAAIACHRSQATDNPVLWRRLSLMGAEESLRWLRRQAEAPYGSTNAPARSGADRGVARP